MKFYGSVGFWKGEVESKPGVWVPEVEERLYFGDIILSHRRFSPSQHQNDDFSITNRISILSDLYAQQNWSSIKYVVWNGAKWKVSSIEVTYPRLILEIGGVYNENEGRAEDPIP